MSEPAVGEPRWQTLPEPGPMPEPDETGHAPVNGIRMYYAIFNRSGSDPVILLHGGMGNSDHWGNQVPVLMKRHKVIVADSRGQGRSTRTAEPLGYRLMAGDVLALMDHLEIGEAAIVGWSDGAITGLQIAMSAPRRISRLWAEGANSNPAALMHPRGRPTLRAMGERASREYARLSPAPDDFAAAKQAVRVMWSDEPNFTPGDFASIAVPTAIVAGEDDELVKRENTEEMARLIPGARLIILVDVSHFGLWQDGDGYNAALLNFLDVETA